MVKGQLTSEKFRSVINALTERYSSIYIINMATREYECIKVHPVSQEIINQTNNAKIAFDIYIKKHVSQEYHKELLKTNDLDVLAVRLAKEKSISVEFTVKYDSTYWCKAQWTALETNNGLATTVLFTVEDIHEDKAKDEKEKRLTRYINGLISGYDVLMFYNMDSDLCSYSYFYPGAPEEVKIPLEYVKSFSQLFKSCMMRYCHPDHLKQMLVYGDREYVSQLLKRKKRHCQRFLFLNHKKEYRWTEFQIIKFNDDDSLPTDIAVTFTNVDADERERRAQQAALEDVTNVVNSSQMGIWHIYLVQGKKPRLTVNDKMRELLGIDEKEVLSEEELYEAWASRIHPGALDSVNASVANMISGSLDENTYLWIHPTKGERYVRCGGQATPILGGHMLFGYHYDVTEHVLAEMRQKQITEEALQANKTKTIFLHNMVHEIRNPLNAIIGFSQLLGMPDGSWTPQEKEDHNKQINSAYSILSMLIDDVIDIADSDHGNYVIKNTNTHINNLCREVLRAAEFRRPKAVKMLFSTEVDDDFAIISDDRRISQVLVNFLTNACKHTWAGEIRLHASVTENPGRLTLSVTDTGEGVPKDMAEQIFQRFTKHNANIKGSGIGLNICSVIAEKLHGEVKLDTKYTNGARFVFIL